MHRLIRDEIGDKYPSLLILWVDNSLFYTVSPKIPRRIGPHLAKQ